MDFDQWSGSEPFPDPRWDRHGQSTSSQEILASLKALLLCDYDVSQFSDLPSHSFASSSFLSKNVTIQSKINSVKWVLLSSGIFLGNLTIEIPMIPVESGKNCIKRSSNQYFFRKLLSRIF